MYTMSVVVMAFLYLESHESSKLLYVNVNYFT